MATPPRIFAPHRRTAAIARMLALQSRADAPSYLAEDVAEDVLDRLSFLRFAPSTALVTGGLSSILADALAAQGIAVTRADPLALDEEAPYPGLGVTGGFDLIASVLTLDRANDLPGALIHIRNALAPGGLAIVTLIGAGSLPILRAAMLEADGERPSPRIHPQVDVRAGGQLLQRAGFANPVVDSRGLDVRFGSLEALVADLRAQGLSNVLEKAGPAYGKAWLARARAAFAPEGERVTEHFELLTLSGWRK